MLNYRQQKILIFGICGAIAGLIIYFGLQLTGINSISSDFEFPNIFNLDLRIHSLLILGYSVSVSIILIYFGHIYVDKTEFQLISLLRGILLGCFCATVGYVILAILPISEFFLSEVSEFTLKHIILVYAVFFALSFDLKLKRIGVASIIYGFAAIQFIHFWNFGNDSVITGLVLNGVTLGVVVAFFNPEFSNNKDKNLLNLIAHKDRFIIQFQRVSKSDYINLINFSTV